MRDNPLTRSEIPDPQHISHAQFQIFLSHWRSQLFEQHAIVSIGNFLSNPGCCLGRGVYYSIFSSFPFYSSDVKKGPYENKSNHSVGSGLFHWRPS